MSGEFKLPISLSKTSPSTKSYRMLCQPSQKRKDSLVLHSSNLESKILNAQAEVESAKLMRQTADILSGKAAMQIRYL